MIVVLTFALLGEKLVFMFWHRVLVVQHVGLLSREIFSSSMNSHLTVFVLLSRFLSCIQRHLNRFLQIFSFKQVALLSTFVPEAVHYEFLDLNSQALYLSEFIYSSLVHQNTVLPRSLVSRSVFWKRCNLTILTFDQGRTLATRCILELCFSQANIQDRDL